MLAGVTPRPKREAEAEAFDARLRDYFLRYDAPEHLRKMHLAIEALRTGKEKAEKAIVTTMIMAEMEKPRPTFVLGRGDYRNRGEKVSAGVPAVLPPLPPDAPPNRLGLT